MSVVSFTSAATEMRLSSHYSAIDNILGEQTHIDEAAGIRGKVHICAKRFTYLMLRIPLFD
jgi:hypothetical protein